MCIDCVKFSDENFKVKSALEWFQVCRLKIPISMLRAHYHYHWIHQNDFDVIENVRFHKRNRHFVYTFSRLSPAHHQNRFSHSSVIYRSRAFIWIYLSSYAGTYIATVKNCAKIDELRKTLRCFRLAHEKKREMRTLSIREVAVPW